MMISNLIDCYRAIENVSQSMVDSAQAQSWPDLVMHENTCSILISNLRKMGEEQTLSQEQMQEKRQIMQRILRNDAQVRNLVEPWLDKLDCIMNGGRQPVLN